MQRQTRAKIRTISDAKTALVTEPLTKKRAVEIFRRLTSPERQHRLRDWHRFLSELVETGRVDSSKAERWKRRSPWQRNFEDSSWQNQR